MKKLAILILVMLLLYTIGVQVFVTLLDFLSQSKYVSPWRSIVFSVIPNLIGIGACTYLIIKLVKNNFKAIKMDK